MNDMFEFIISNFFQLYYVILLLGWVISFICICLIEPLSKLEKLYLLSCYIFSALGMLIGSKLVYLVENILIKQKLSDILSVNYIFSGFSYMGGVLGYIIFIKIYNKIYKDVPNKINHLLTLALSIIYSISKVGCYITGCCNGITNIPIQIIESFLYFSIFMIFSYLYRKYNKKEMIANLSIVVLCISRCIIDFFRIKRGLVILNISVTQIICITTIIVKLIKVNKSSEIVANVQLYKRGEEYDKNNYLQK